jgi:predicted MFS family arabinose efflux permease
MMLAGLAIMMVTGIALYFVVSLWAAVVVMTVMGLSTILYVPAQQAYLGDNVPYARRGRIMAIAEVAWSLAAIIGLPLMGIVVQAYGWRVGFVAVGLFSLVALTLLWFALPREKRTAPRAARAMGGAYLEALRAPMAVAVIATTFLLAAANENINIVFADWMNISFGLDAVALGVVGSAIGGAEFAAQMTVALFVDRIGKWRMVAGGLVLGALAYAALPFLGATAMSGGAGIVLTFFTFELTIVAALPLITEIAPNVRATLLSLGVAGFSLGRAAGSFIGPAVYAQYGFGAASFVSAAGIFVACVIWFLFVREKHPEVVST